MKNETVSSIGEFGIIEIIKRKFAVFSHNKSIITGIGDDCFCFKMGKSTVCITKDMLIENVHFRKDWITAKELGQKAIEVNISDVAAMGNVEPKYAFIGLGVPYNTSKKFIEDLADGFDKSCKKYKMAIAGGDTVKAEKITISVTIIVITKDKIIKRICAKPGDLIGVTNTFGDAGAGVSLLYKYGTKHKYSKEERLLIYKQNNPIARLNEAHKIAKYLTSLTDASDGLYISVGLLTKDSGFGANVYVDKIPLSSSLKKVFKDKKKQLNFALFGGEDYELVLTVPKSKAQIVQKLVPQVIYIGEINTLKEIRYFNNGKEQKIKYLGFKHF
ncbi:MAG: thiamine-phosphate kinase [Clostridiales Family XIII bacterium]|jgi:thiamine-monophosphate kinase|nr:thiamine-phosphate kinase [Clostridiales Family XIII bacterium]